MKTAGMVLLAVMVFATGCGRVKDKASRATSKAGQLVGEGASTFFTGVGAGIDKTVTTYDVRLSEELRSAAVSTTIAKRMDGSASNNWQQTLSIYVQNQTPLTGTLRIRLFNDNDQEIGRSITPVVFAKDDARYVSFTLDKEIPVTMTKYVQMDLKKE
jgi:hypothetical protein